MDYALESLLENRRWLQRTDPFPHVVASNVFTSRLHADLTQQLRELLAKGLSEDCDPQRLSRNIAGYDAYAINLQTGQDGPFGLFLSSAWHDMLARIFDVNATGHVNCGLHHHPVGCSSGWVHNDLNPGWFAETGSNNGVKVAQHHLCNYMSGKRHKPEISVIETIRAVAMLYYFGNAPWRQGDGGSTGLYRSKDDPVDRPAAVVPPINNSLLAFECTPYSFHSYIRNWRSARTCVIMWLHRPKAEAVARWGQRKIVEWPKTLS
jgi:hypothetical protein